jgi:hypothetical protein
MLASEGCWIKYGLSAGFWKCEHLKLSSHWHNSIGGKFLTGLLWQAAVKWQVH